MFKLTLHTCSLVTAIILIIYIEKALTQDYIGCYRDDNDARALPQKTDYGGSTQICQRYCQSNSLYTYFGTQYHYQCYCGETYDRYGRVNESECSSTCTNDPTQKCGAAGRNSVYYVCPKGMFGRACDQTCHCKDGEFCDRNGTCLRRVGCEKGWEGDSCSRDIDECSPPGSYCNQNCTNSPGSFTCSCYHSGFYLDTSNNITCLDVDECLTDKGGCNHTCTNTDGSYHCECDEGYHLTAGGKLCQDIDECATLNGQCTHSCNNTAGSYFCSCPANLWLSGDGYSCKDTTVNGLKIACIVLACLFGVSLLINMVYTYLQFCRRKSNPVRGKNSDAAFKTHSYVNDTTIEGIKNHVTKKNEIKLSEQVVSPSKRQLTDVTGSEGQTVPEYQEIKPVAKFDQAKDYEQLDEKDRRKEAKRQDKETNNYTPLVK